MTLHGFVKNFNLFAHTYMLSGIMFQLVKSEVLGEGEELEWVCSMYVYAMNSFVSHQKTNQTGGMLRHYQ